MTETTTTTDETIEEKTNSGEVTIPSPSENRLTTKKETIPSKKATPPKKTSSRKRPSRAKSTSKRKQPAKKAHGKVKETKPAKTTKETKAKETKTETTKTKAIKGEPAKETKEETSKPLTPALGQLDMRHQFILYTMARMNREVTYAELGSETGLSRAVLRRVINAQIGDNSLVSKGLAKVNQYETEEGEVLPYYFCLTSDGKKLVS